MLWIRLDSFMKPLCGGRLTSIACAKSVIAPERERDSYKMMQQMTKTVRMYLLNFLLEIYPHERNIKLKKSFSFIETRERPCLITQTLDLPF